MPDKKTILIIDDEPEFVDALRGTLNYRGYHIVTAGDGREGLKEMERSRPDMIILDLSMPRMSGLEFLNLIQDDRGRSSVPTLVVSAREELRGVFKDLDITGFLTKPVKLEEILRDVESVLKASAAAPAPSPAPNRVKTEWKALLVEDDRENAAAIASLMESVGYTVKVIPSGIEALSAAMSDVPDIALIKLGLKDFSGDEVAYEFRMMPKTAGVPIILYTPHYDTLNHMVTQNICQKIGIKDVLAFSEPRTLVNESERLLGRL